MLLLSGAIELNPGPRNATSKFKKPVTNTKRMKHRAPIYDECEKSIRNNSKKVLCIHCE